MKQLIKRSMPVIVSLALMITSLTLSAQGPAKGMRPNTNQAQNGSGCRIDQVIDQIPTITPDQKTKIEDLRFKHMSKTTELKARIREKNAHLETLALAERPDNKAIEASIDELFRMKADLRKMQMAFRIEVRMILTPEQRMIFDQRMSNFKNSNSGPGQSGPGQKPMRQHSQPQGNERIPAQ